MEEITATQSVRIDEELKRIPEIIEKYSAYYYASDPKSCLRNMRNEVMDVFNFSFIDIDD